MNALYALLSLHLWTGRDPGGSDFIMDSVAILPWLTPIVKKKKVHTKQKNHFWTKVTGKPPLSKYYMYIYI